MSKDETGIEDAFSIGLAAWPASGFALVAFQLSKAARLAVGSGTMVSKAAATKSATLKTGLPSRARPHLSSCRQRRIPALDV